MQNDKVNEYAGFIDSERKFINDNRDVVKKLMKDLPNRSFLLLRKIFLKVMAVNADSDPAKSHWALAQIREILSEWNDELSLVTKFEKAEKRVREYDVERAGEGDVGA